MVAQFALPKKTRDQSKRTDVHKAGILTEAAEHAPRLALDLAKRLFGEGDDLRKIYKKTGWYREGDRWLYDYSDQGMKVREDNKLLLKPGTKPYMQGAVVGDPGYVHEQPKAPMKKEPGEELGYTKRGRRLEAMDENDPVGLMSQDMPTQAKQYPGPHPGSITPKTPDRPPQVLDWMETPADPAQARFGDIEPSFDTGATGMVRGNFGRTPTFEELFSHPLQERLNPDLGKIPIEEAHYTFEKPGDRPNYSGSFNMWPAWYEPNQRLNEFQPGSLNEAKVRARGQLGGVQMPYSMESVALHEVGGHGAQQRFQLPQGANATMPGMDVRGQEMPKDAKKQLDAMSQFYREEMRKLEQEEGLSRTDAGIEFRRLFPDYWPTRTKYMDVSNSQVSAPVTTSKWTGGPQGKVTANDPAYLGYRGSAGEQQAMNLQNRAIKTQNELPLTDTGFWTTPKEAYVYRAGQEDPSFEPVSRSYNLYPSTIASQGRPHQGDVYPLDTYEIPPDLTEQKVVTGLDRKGTVDDVSRPALGDYDWMWKGGMGAAGAGTLATTMAQGSPASASEGPEDTFSTPKADRLPLAASMSKQDRVPYEGDWVHGKRGTPPNPFPTNEELYGSQITNLPSHARSGLESVLGMSGDLAESGMNPAGTLMRAGLGRWGAPGSAEVGEATDWLAGYLPQGAQDWLNQYTRNPSQDPGSQMLGTGVEMAVDPTNLFGAGAAAHGARGAATALPDLWRLF